MKIENEIQNGSAEKRQAVLYPYTSLAPSLKIADAVKELGGARSPVSKHSLAAHFKEGDKSASFLQRVASAKAFGIISGRSDYSLTETAKRYYFPTAESAKSNALLAFLAAPSSFSEIIRLYDGDKLPTREILANILQRDLKVPESWKDRVASFFENSAQFIGVLDEKRFLRIKATQQAGTIQTTVNKGQHQPLSPIFAGSGQPVSGGSPTVFSDQEEHSLFLDKERTKRITLSCPLFITRTEYERICKWIDATWIIEDEKKNE